MPKKLFGHCAALTPSGTELLVAGGFDGSDYSGSALAYNFETGVWKTQDFMLTSPRFDHVCNLVVRGTGLQVYLNYLNALHLHKITRVCTVINL